MRSIYKKKILFIGMPDMAVICLTRLVAEGFNIVGVIPPHHSDSSCVLLTSLAENLGLNVLTFEKSINGPDLINKVKMLDADIAVVASYNKKFSPHLLRSVKGGFVNAHPSLLPDYRGANAYSNVLINNEKETGVTLHFMDEDFDTGNIIWQKSMPVEKDETMGTLFNKQNYLSAQMLVDFLKFYEEHDKIDSKPQPKGEFKKANNISFEDGESRIDWTKDAVYIERYIRALNPFISALASYQNVFMKIHSAQVQNKRVKEAPGTIVSLGDTLGVATGDGVLQIKSLQFGSYMISDAKAFIHRFQPKVGEVLI